MLQLWWAVNAILFYLVFWVTCLKRSVLSWFWRIVPAALCRSITHLEPVGPDREKRKISHQKLKSAMMTTRSSRVNQVEVSEPSSQSTSGPNLPKPHPKNCSQRRLRPIGVANGASSLWRPVRCLAIFAKSGSVAQSDRLHNSPRKEWADFALGSPLVLCALRASISYVSCPRKEWERTWRIIW